MCINEYKFKLGSTLKSIVKNVQLREIVKTPRECNNLNMDYGFGDNGCFSNLINDYMSLSKQIRRYLSSEVLKNFTQISEDTELEFEKI